MTLLVSVIVCACASKKTDANDEGHPATLDANVWKEMDEFHIIMAEAFHPYKDSSNLEPAKKGASGLLRAANAWAAAPLPDKVNNDQVKSKLQQLKSEATTLAESVQSADDNVIAEQLTKLHDTFHAIQEEWYH